MCCIDNTNKTIRLQYIGSTGGGVTNGGYNVYEIYSGYAYIQSYNIIVAYS